MIAEVIRFTNEPVSSNSYIIISQQNRECIIIDPGSKYPQSIIDYLEANKLVPTHIFLTHEHFDHIWGTNILKEKYNSKIVCSYRCRDKIIIPQNYFNLLYFSDDTLFYINHIDIITDEVKLIEWNGIKFYFMNTPGHSSSSICIYAEKKYLFTGDTLMKGYKPFIKKRHEGSFEDFKKSLNDIYSYYSSDILVFPGHGDCFRLEESKEFYKQYL